MIEYDIMCGKYHLIGDEFDLMDDMYHLMILFETVLCGLISLYESLYF